MEEQADPQELDLAQVNWPFCLLELKSALGGLSKGQILRVRVSDPVVLSTMEQVLHSSPDKVIEKQATDTLYALTVQKG